MNQKIKFIRQKLGLSEKEVSSFLNISSYKYSSYEKNDIPLPCEILLLLSKMYGINISLLIYDFFNEDDLTFELEQLGFTNTINKTEVLKKLRLNLFSNLSTSSNYHSIRKIKHSFQCAIVSCIKESLRSFNLTQQHLAASCNLDEIELNYILSCKKFITLSELMKITEFLQIPIDYITKY